MTTRLKSIPTLLFLLFFCCACASKQAATSDEKLPEVIGPVIPSQPVEEQTVADENYGPIVPEPGVIILPPENSVATSGSINTDTATSAAAPQPAKLCVVLGPGMAKAMAEAAVLASLKKAKIPVDCLVGSEMGAVVGALYAFSNGSTNSLQWQLFKLNKENYFNFPMISLRDPKSSGKKLNEFFRGVFKEKKIEELPILFATSAIDEERETDVNFDRGDLADALSASVAVPGAFDAWRINDGVFRSAALSNPAPIELARKMGGNFIVLVDVLNDSNLENTKSRYQKIFAPARSLLRLQKKEASFLIEVNTAKILYDDFSRQGEILSAGTAATEKALPELKAAWENWIAGAR